LHRDLHHIGRRVTASCRQSCLGPFTRLSSVTGRLICNTGGST
jgi:hypothetical protein